MRVLEKDGLEAASSQSCLYTAARACTCNREFMHAFNDILVLSFDAHKIHSIRKTTRMASQAHYSLFPYAK